MQYVLQRTGSSVAMYVAPPGQAKSYTKDLSKAQTYQDKATAQASACGNEKVVEYGA